MKKHKTTLLLAAFVLTASFAYAQCVKITPIHSDTIVYNEKSIPEPTVYIGENLTGGVQTKELLLENPCVTAKSGELEWSIVSYRVTFVKIINSKGEVSEGVEEPPITVMGACFTNEIISKIKSKLYPLGVNIEFSDIKIQNSAGIRTIPTILMVRIK
jgi:hypothetical protein